MLAVQEPEALRNHLNEARQAGATVGLVPTMGALHDGHLALISRSRAENDLTVVSIFVNPLQFNNRVDLENYPRDISSDAGILAESGIDVLFHPSASTMYPLPERLRTTLTMEGPARVLEGHFRPGHFDGVLSVVMKLFSIVHPRRAYFGLKDLQQYVLIKHFVRDYFLNIDVVGVETVREEGGLALSSRNKRLSAEGHKVASSIYAGLSLAKAGLEQRKPLKEIRKSLLSFYEKVKGLEIEYAELVDGESLQQCETYSESGSVAVCVAAYVEGVRLIDNIYLRLES